MLFIAPMIAPEYQKVTAQVIKIDGPFQSLSGRAKFTSNNSTATDFTRPDFDDSAWQEVQLPGMMSDHGASIWHQVGWYRIRFELDKNFNAQRPALGGYLFKDHEVYLNGVRIDQNPPLIITGLTASGGTTFGRFRLHEFPSDLFNREGANVLAIRMSRLMISDNNGITREPFGLMDASHAIEAMLSIQSVHSFLQGIIYGIHILNACFALALILFGLRDRAVNWFFVLSLSFLYADLGIFDWFNDAGYKTLSYTRWNIILLGLIFIANLNFCVAMLDRRLGFVGWFFVFSIAFGISCAIGLPLYLPPDLALSYVKIALIFWNIGLLPAFIWIAIMALRTAMGGNKMGWYMFIIYSITVSLPTIITMLWGAEVDVLIVKFGLDISNIVIPLYFLSLTALIAIRLYGLETERVLANERAVRAQSDERQRVARDMHDSVGQWLGSVKMRLQMMGAEVSGGQKIERERLSELVGDMDVLIDDTRRIARDLSPSSVAHKGLEQAIYEHGTYLHDDHGIKTNLQLEEGLGLPQHYADHVYRIIQEASNNAAIHGAATQIIISLKRLSSGLIELKISDNGNGFDTNSKQDRHSLGLTSIRERAQMLNGAAEIKSQKGEGTSIRILF